MKVFYRALRWRLGQNDCANRGYILHNFPTNLAELEYIFNKVNPRKFKSKKPKPKKVVPKEVSQQSIASEGEEGEPKEPKE